MGKTTIRRYLAADRFKTATHLTLLFALVYALALSATSSLTFFSNDTGLRFLQIQDLIANQWRSFAIAYPARFLDPELAHPPFYYAYSLLDGEFYLQISSFLPLLTSYLYVALGKWGLPLLPVLGGGEIIGGWQSHSLLESTETGI